MQQKSLGLIETQGLAAGIEAVAALPDPVGRTLDEFVRPDGLRICKRSVPMGVIAIIYESRPNVTSDAASLTFQAGSVCVLRGGKESIHSNTAIVRALHKAHQLPVGHGYRLLGQTALRPGGGVTAKVHRAQHQPDGQRQQIRRQRQRAAAGEPVFQSLHCALTSIGIGAKPASVTRYKSVSPLCAAASLSVNKLA